MTILEEFQAFISQCYPRGVGAQQEKDLRDAFFAGALVVMAAMHEVSHMDPKAGVIMVSKLDRELKDYGRGLGQVHPTARN